MPANAYRSAIAVTLIALLSIAGTSPARADELRRRGLIGVQLTPGEHGAGVGQAMPGTPAEKAGLRAGDVIVKVNGEDVPDLQAFLSLMRKFYGGDTLKLSVERAGDTIETELTLAPRPMETSDLHEVIYDFCKSDGKMARTLITKPSGEGRHPAILLIPSPVPQSAEYPPQMAQHPYQLTLNALSKAGIVTMRVERFGVGDSEGGDPQTTTLDADVALYRSALKRLSQYEFVNPARVYIFSQGLGSAIAPMVANDPTARGAISYAPTAVRPWTVGMVEMHRRIWDLETVKLEEIDRRAKELEKYLAACAKKGANPRELLNDYPALLPIADSISPRADVLFGVQTHYVQAILNADLVAEWSKVDAPVLSLWGEADFQSSEGDAKAIATAVNKSHPGRATYKALPEVDHGMYQADDQEDSYLSGYQGGDYNDIVVKTIIDWVKLQKPQAA